MLETCYLEGFFYRDIIRIDADDRPVGGCCYFLLLFEAMWKEGDWRLFSCDIVQTSAAAGFMGNNCCCGIVRTHAEDWWVGLSDEQIPI